MDCWIVLSERPPQDIVLHIDDVARTIRDDIFADVAAALGREIPVNVDTSYEDIGPHLIRDGYTLSGSNPISGGGRTVHVDLYKRIGYAAGSDYGEAKATVVLRSKPQPDKFERIALNVSAGPAPIRPQHP